MSTYSDPLHDVFDELEREIDDFDYHTGVPDRVNYSFAGRYDDVEDGAVEDAGRYAAVLDAVIEDWGQRERVYRSIVAGRDACYLPDATGRDTEQPLLTPDEVSLDDADPERNGLKRDMEQYMQNTGTMEQNWDTFADVYDSTTEGIRQTLEG